MSALAAAAAEGRWYLHGVLTPGGTTSLTGLWKIGKTTWLARLLAALGGDAEFSGLAVSPARVLIVSEEGERLWAARRDELGLGDHVAVICKPFLGRPDRAGWEGFVSHLAAAAADGDYRIVVFDSLFNLWPVADENDAAQVLTALAPMNALTTANIAVLLVCHPTKSDAGEARATRGSGALGGFVDVILEMRRYDPERREDTRRVLTGYSRFDETPAEIVLEYSKEAGYRAVGTRAAARSEDRRGAMRELLPDGPTGATVEELLDRWTDEAPRPGARTLRRELEAEFAAGRVARTGAGKKNDPHRYHGKNSIPASSLSIGRNGIECPNGHAPPAPAIPRPPPCTCDEVSVRKIGDRWLCSGCGGAPVPLEAAP